MWILHIEDKSIVEARIRLCSEVDTLSNFVVTQSESFKNKINLSIYRINISKYPPAPNSLIFPPFDSPLMSTCDGQYTNNQSLLVC